MMTPTQEMNAHYTQTTPAQKDELTFTIAQDHSGERLDLALAGLLPEHSRNRIKQWIESGFVRVNQKPVLPKTKVLTGDVIWVAPPVEPHALNLPQDHEIFIVDETEGYLIIDKPAGVTVHPGAGNPDHTLLNALLFHRPMLANLPRAGIVHRLDKDTGGLMVVAKTETMHTALVRALANRTVKREYTALVWGDFPRDAVIEAPIGRHPKDRVKMAVVSRGKPARTHVFVQQRWGRVTLITCRLETGRTHQIRVHCAAMGHPLVGDPVYGKTTVVKDAPDALKTFKRQALHATRLAFSDPVSGENREWVSPLPEDFAALLAFAQK
ncbi:MAG: RluA family pseudouridine synthase [Burkholderiales bacterium]|jgi:23S rRNA pseudouridine1911/1915/1917 synthase|nr:RluA family pseudouridine synthase [Burkholderiales bacterium]